MDLASSDSKLSPPTYDDACPTFHRFSEIPPELRAQVWQSALKPRIVRWTRTSNRNSFTTPSRSLPLMLVSREAREAAFLYGSYQTLTDYLDPVYFSPNLDYFWFDPGWTEVGIPSYAVPKDPLNEILPKLGVLRNIMVHPNWSGHPRTPAVLFGKLPNIRQVLVAADERSIGFHGKVMLDTVKEIKSYYSALENQGVAMKTPYIAVGCIGWVGEERKRIHHGRRDNRQLVKVFEKQWEINIHMHNLREEEWQFSHNNFNQPKIVHKLRFCQRTGEESERMLSSNARSDPQPSNVQPDAQESDSILDLSEFSSMLSTYM